MIVPRFLKAAASIALFLAVLGLVSTTTCGPTEYTVEATGKIAFQQLDRPRYPCGIYLFNTVARRLRLRPFSLDQDHLVAEATKRTGLRVFGSDDSWRESLRQLLHSIESEADLSALGRFMTQQQLISSLSERARVHKLLEDEPAIRREPLRPPLVITGMPRTGTTLLHTMLALSGHPQAQYLSYAESLHPSAAAGAEHEAAETEIGQAVWFMSMVRPLFSRMHEMAAALPHEELHLQARSTSRPAVASVAEFCYLLPGALLLLDALREPVPHALLRRTLRESDRPHSVVRIRARATARPFRCLAATLL
jgi:hypothetical protein